MSGEPDWPLSPANPRPLPAAEALAGEPAATPMPVRSLRSPKGTLHSTRGAEGLPASWDAPNPPIFVCSSGSPTHATASRDVAGLTLRRPSAPKSSGSLQGRLRSPRLANQLRTSQPRSRIRIPLDSSLVFRMPRHLPQNESPAPVSRCRALRRAAAAFDPRTASNRPRSSPANSGKPEKQNHSRDERAATTRQSGRCQQAGFEHRAGGPSAPTPKGGHRQPRVSLSLPEGRTERRAKTARHPRRMESGIRRNHHLADGPDSTPTASRRSEQARPGWRSEEPRFPAFRMRSHHLQVGCPACREVRARSRTRSR
jgi:hypothetical protein